MTCAIAALYQFRCSTSVRNRSSLRRSRDILPASLALRSRLDLPSGTKRQACTISGGLPSSRHAATRSGIAYGNSSDGVKCVTLTCVPLLPYAALTGTVRVSPALTVASPQSLGIGSRPKHFRLGLLRSVHLGALSLYGLATQEPGKVHKAADRGIHASEIE